MKVAVFSSGRRNRQGTVWSIPDSSLRITGMSAMLWVKQTGRNENSLSQLPIRSHRGNARFLTAEVEAAGNQARMAPPLALAYGGQAQVVSLHDLDIKGPGSECLRNAADFECI